jgi:hypothetical protein
MVNVRIGGREADPRSVDRGNFTPDIHEWVASSKENVLCHVIGILWLY